jgi:S-adenosylmethionine:tRNA ribosyltransferase-isomerase
LASEQDWQRYQTTYARHDGAVAAPTAGLHFTEELLMACRENGIEQTYVTLHVGIGTFRPIAVEKLSEHHMHSERCEITTEAANEINRTRQNGGRIVAVGTTSVRTLESAVRGHNVEAGRGETSLFIRPPYEFRAVDCLLTNFHLPRSTLLVLVSAFAGPELIRAAYQIAVNERYRFYSYGDAMLIL